ncbi:hypothetical protein DSO57_1005539 [Entomophthora muscae]|uniref:Uncharacterized protein n=1 Tax=Entomophthora muscae TaxID=34485 RepID=A0ACC2TJ56_9FUNG|nr:hypothetical protein DSO57_1005539 [Entomophthora muscae]
MNHLIFSAVYTACLRIGGHQYNQQHGPFNNPSGKYYYKKPAQLNSSKWYSWPTLVLPHSTQSVAIYTCIYYKLIRRIQAIEAISSCHTFLVNKPCLLNPPHQATCLSTLTPKLPPIPSPTISDAVPFTGADEGNVHSAHSLPLPFL